MADAPVLTAIQLAGRTSADIPNLYSAEEDLAFHQGLIAGKTVMVAERDGVPVDFAAIRDGGLDHLWIRRRFTARALAGLCWPGPERLAISSATSSPTTSALSPSTAPTGPCRSARATARATRSAFPT